MQIVYLPRFTRQFKKLPRDIQLAAREREQWFRNNPHDPRLHTHKLGGSLDGCWAFSVTHRHRIVFEFVGHGSARFFTIGGHNIYDA